MKILHVINIVFIEGGTWLSGFITENIGAQYNCPRRHTWHPWKYITGILWQKHQYCEGIYNEKVSKEIAD